MSRERWKRLYRLYRLLINKHGSVALALADIDIDWNNGYSFAEVCLLARLLESRGRAMTTYKFERVLVLSPLEVPSEVKPDAIIFNAPRPVFGSMALERTALVWEGPFVGGRHYAAIYPDDPDRDLWLAHNRQMKAIVVSPIDDSSAQQLVREWLVAEGYEADEEYFSSTWRDIFYTYLATGEIEIEGVTHEDA